jgi:hypothetical protein
MVTLNPVTASKIEYLMGLRKAHYDDVKTLRDYANGATPVYLTDDQKIQLVGEDSAGNPNSDPEFALNVCETTLGVEVDRLNVQDIAVVMAGNEEASANLSSLVWQWWKRNRLDEGQQHAHYAACRDRDSFAIVHYDKEEKYPKLAINQVYDGETSGADMFYTDDDPMQPGTAVKIWIAEETEAKKIRRKNVYYADRVEKWISEGVALGKFVDADWRPLRYGDIDWEEGLYEVDSLSQPGKVATVAWWTESGTESSPGMGIPVKHFRHDARGTAYGTSTIDPLVPGLQDAINRAALDVQAASVLAGFPANYIIGADRDDTTWTIGPSQLLVVENSSGSAGQFPAANLEQLVRVKDTFIKDAATLTSTPLTYFNLSGVIPAEGTQQSLEMALLAKVGRNQVAFGNTWEDIIRMMLKMEFVWGVGLKGIIASHEQIEQLEINCEWASAKVKDEKEQAEIAQLLKALGVPDRFVFRHLGYSEDEIDQMVTEKDAKRNAVIGAMAERAGQMETENAQAQALALEKARKDGEDSAAKPEPDSIAA